MRSVECKPKLPQYSRNWSPTLLLKPIKFPKWIILTSDPRPSRSHSRSKAPLSQLPIWSRHLVSLKESSAVPPTISIKWRRRRKKNWCAWGRSWPISLPSSTRASPHSWTQRRRKKSSKWRARTGWSTSGKTSHTTILYYSLRLLAKPSCWKKTLRCKQWGGRSLLRIWRRRNFCYRV